MGHYWSEMEDRAADEYDYRAVNDAGFQSVYIGSSRASVKRCPHCFALVEGEFALAHVEAVHPIGAKHQN